MVEIPRFNEEDSLEIGLVFNEEHIPFEKRPIQTRISASGGGHEYTFIVSETNFTKAVLLLKKFFNISEQKEQLVVFSGICPGCGSLIDNKKECPECELNLIFDPMEFYKGHPFIDFLIEKGL